MLSHPFSTRQNCTAALGGGAIWFLGGNHELRHVAFVRCRQYRSGTLYFLAGFSVTPIGNLIMTDARACDQTIDFCLVEAR